jgi:phosphate transport system permease protein
MAVRRGAHRTRRRLVDWTARILAGLCVLVAIVPVGDILYSAALRGGRTLLAPGFFTNFQPLPCTVFEPGSCSNYGGISGALQGTFYLLLFAGGIAIPVGIVAGMFLAEFGRNRIGRTLSFLVEVLTGIPSIVVAVFVYSVFLYYDPILIATATASGGALAIIMLPLVVRTTEEALKQVPQSTREAALALGIPRYRSTLQVVLPGGAPGIMTGALLAVMRAGGEAAPFFIIGGFTQGGFTGYNHALTPLPEFIYNLSASAASNWAADAWGAVLVLMLIMLTLSLSARFLLGRRFVAIGGL